MFARLVVEDAMTERERAHKRATKKARRERAEAQQLNAFKHQQTYGVVVVIVVVVCLRARTYFEDQAKKEKIPLTLTHTGHFDVVVVGV